MRAEYAGQAVWWYGAMLLLAECFHAPPTFCRKVVNSMFDNLALVIGYLVLLAGGIYLVVVVGVVVNARAMFRQLGIRRFLMLSTYMGTWVWMFYGLAHSDRYSLLEIILPPLLGTAALIVSLTRR